MAPSLVQAPTPFRAPEALGARRGAIARRAAGCAAILFSCLLITTARASPKDAPARTFTVLGRVVDERRARVPGALVRVHSRKIDNALVSEGTTDARGRFRVEVPVADLLRASDATWSVLVRHEGRVGAGSTTSSAHGVGFADTIVVAPGLDVPVRLADRRAGVPVRASLWGLLCAEAVSDAEGRALLRNLPPTWISFDAGARHAGRDLKVERAPVPEVSLADQPLRPVLVDVTGVPPDAREHTWVEVLHPRRTGGPSERFSFARAREGPLDVPPEALIRAVIEYPSPPHATARWVTLPAGASRVDVHVEQPIPARWPVSAGSARVPPDGTVLRVLPLARATERAFSASGRVERGHIVVDAVGVETEIGWAFAPDGSGARLVQSPYGRGPIPTKFQRARTIDVRLRENDGRPVVGALLDLNYGPEYLRPPILDRPTDAEGRTRVVLFEDGPHTFTIAEGAASVHRLARVEAGGDAAVDVVVPRKVTVVLRLLLEGKPCLPSRYSLSCLGQDIEDAEEDAERGEIRFEARPSEQGEPMTLYFGGAFGWTPEEGAKPGGLRPTVVPGVPLTLRFRRLGIVRVRLSAPNAATDAGRDVDLQSFDGDRWSTVSDKGSWNWHLSIVPDVPLLMPLDRGTWRLRDEATGRTTKPVVIGTPATEEIVDRILEIGP